MLGDSVVEVKHCMDPRSGKVTDATYVLLGASLVCLATAAASFVVGIHVASRNAAALDYWTHVAHKPAYAFRAEPASTGLDALEIGGLAFGLAAAAAGLSRARRERRSPYFRIGTAAGVELATDAAPSPSFPLVAPSGDDFVFNFAAGMEGEMIVAGASTPFAELIASGRARPSAIVSGALELPIPAASRIRARAGATTFLVSAVDRPRAQPLAGFALDCRAALYAAASLVAHIGIYSLAQLGSADAASIGIGLNNGEDITTRSAMSANEETPPPPPPDATGNNDGDTGGGGRMALTEGAAGKPTADKIDGQMQVKDNHRDEVQVARQDAIEYARTAGILGDTRALDSTISALGGTADYSNGFDTSDIYGPLIGASGEGKGNFGMGRSGWGAGGGCGPGDECRGIGAGPYHTVGIGPRAGAKWGFGTGNNPHMPGHDPLIPTVKILPPTVTGDLDKAIIHRYVRREQNKLSYCYEHELLAHPTLQGDILVKFFIAPDGSVQASTGTGFDTTVANCVADVVRAISFPAPKDGGGVTVNYPFHFHTATAQ